MYLGRAKGKLQQQQLTATTVTERGPRARNRTESWSLFLSPAPLVPFLLPFPLAGDSWTKWSLAAHEALLPSQFVIQLVVLFRQQRKIVDTIDRSGRGNLLSGLLFYRRCWLPPLILTYFSDGGFWLILMFWLVRLFMLTFFLYTSAFQCYCVF